MAIPYPASSIHHAYATADTNDVAVLSKMTNDMESTQPALAMKLRAFAPRAQSDQRPIGLY